MTKPKSNVQREAEIYTVALEAFPEFAAQVGVLLSCYALLESYVHRLISRTTGMDESDAFLVAGSYLNVGPRIDLLETLLKKRDHAAREVIAARHFVGTLREATKTRNIYAHGAYSLGFEGGRFSPTAKKLITIRSFSYDAKRNGAVTTERDLNGVQKDVARMKFITSELHGYLFRDEMPVD